MADLLSLAIRVVKAMSRASNLEVWVGAIMSTLSSNKTHIGEMESQLASKNLEFDAATAELDSTE